MASDLIVRRPQGLYCPMGDFYIDPWRAVDRALITHAHADHARQGHRRYLCAQPGAGVLRARLGTIDLQTLPYGQVLDLNGVKVSFHPAGHVLGSAQVRLEWQGQVWVASGDYKTEPDATCAAFEPVRCHTFITESTFGLPVYRWRPSSDIFTQINDWWRQCAAEQRPALLMGYSFGKAQRLLSGLDAQIGPIYVHRAVEPLNQAYRDEGVALPDTQALSRLKRRADVPGNALVLVPPGADSAALGRLLPHASTAMASGWMQLRGRRRQSSHDRGFILSDHADWPGLVSAIGATGAERVIVTHGQESVLVRWLTEQGLEAGTMATDYGGGGDGNGDADGDVAADASGPAEGQTVSAP